MNTKLLLLAISVAAFSSCTTLYKSGQTPDDVYYSPIRISGYGEEKQEQPQREVVNNYSYEDRSIRLGINDRRWRYLDYNFSNNPYINDYSYNPYNYGFNYGYYYNPYFYPYPVYGSVFVTPSIPKNTTPRIANLSGYNPVYNNNNVSNNTKTGIMRSSSPVRVYNNNNKGSAVGNVIRQVFSPSKNNNNSSSNNNNINNNSSNNNRTYTPSNNNSSSSSSSSGSGSSGSGAVSRPPRN